jgi:hypothetical protein
MAARRRKSTKPSASSSSPRHELTFFIDRSLGRNTFADILRDAGLDVRIHDSEFPSDAADVDWIEQTSKRGWIAIAADEAIARRRSEVEAIHRHGARILVPGLRKRTAKERARLIVDALPILRRFVAQNPGPWVARVSPGREHGSGSVRIAKLGAFR